MVFQSRALSTPTAWRKTLVHHKKYICQPAIAQKMHTHFLGLVIPLYHSNAILHANEERSCGHARYKQGESFHREEELPLRVGTMWRFTL